MTVTATEVKQSLTGDARPAVASPSILLRHPALSSARLGRLRCAPGSGKRGCRAGVGEGRARGSAAGAQGGPTREGAAEPRVQPRSRMGRGAGGALDLEDRFGGQPLIKTFCMKLKKLHSVSV